MIPFVFSRPVRWHECSSAEQTALLTRPAIKNSKNVSTTVSNILNQGLQQGDNALYALNAYFDHIKTSQLQISTEEIKKATSRLSPEIKHAMLVAMANIDRFYRAQQWTGMEIKTLPRRALSIIDSTCSLGRTVYSRWLTVIAIDGAHAGDTGVYLGLQTCYSFVSATYCR